MVSHQPSSWDDIFSGDVSEDDPIWEEYVESAATFDAQMVEGWTKIIDVILVFIALFISVQTSFVIERSKRDHSEVSNLLLLALYNQRATGNSPPINITGLYEQDPAKLTYVNLENSLLYLGFTCSIVISMVAMTAKLWLVKYLNQGSAPGSPFQRAMQRQKAYSGLHAWKLDVVIDALPLLVLLPVIMFWFFVHASITRKQNTSDLITAVIVGAGVEFLLIPSFSAAFISTCPFQSSISGFIRFGYDLFLPGMQHPVQRSVIITLSSIGIMIASMFLMVRVNTMFAVLLYMPAAGAFAMVRQPTPSSRHPRVYGLPIFILVANIAIFTMTSLATYYFRHGHIRKGIGLYSAGGVLILIQGVVIFQISGTAPDTTKVDAIAWLLGSQCALQRPSFFTRACQIANTEQGKPILLKALFSLLEPLIVSSLGRGVQDERQVQELQVYLACLAHLSSFSDVAKSVWENRAAAEHPILPKRLRKQLEGLMDSPNVLLMDAAKVILEYYPRDDDLDNGDRASNRV